MLRADCARLGWVALTCCVWIGGCTEDRPSTTDEVGKTTHKAQIDAAESVVIKADEQVNNHSTVPVVPETPVITLTEAPLALPDVIGRQICSLTRNAPESAFVERFGEPSYREEINGVTNLLWQQAHLRIVAKFSEGELQLAGATLTTPEQKLGLSRLSKLPNELRVGETTRAELEKMMGPGVHTAVSWHHGIDIDAQTAQQNGLPLRALNDHCNNRYTWLESQTGRATTLAFREDILDGHFDE